MKPIQDLVECGVYVDELPRAEHFYREILGLDLAASEPQRHLFFRVGDSMLLVCRADSTLQGGIFPVHGAKGPGHFALGIDRADLDAWRTRLTEYGIPIETEMTWPRGGQSLYFRDPAGNSVELVTPGLWGLPAGW